MPKIRVGILMGGKSVEHEISLESAKSVIDNLNKDKYEVIPVYIDKQGRFKDIQLENIAKTFDVIFPVLHGTYGEDGTIQGLLKYLNIPFVGPGVLGSAIGMDKDVTKKLLKEAGILCANSITVHQTEQNQINYQQIITLLGNTLFIKPASLGSSVGLSKVRSKDKFYQAINKAFLYDNKILIEEFIDGQEIECAVLGNEYPKASILGEIVTKNDFYCYDTKYNDPKGAKLKIPANLPEDISNNIMQLAIKVFKALNCDAMARVDFLVTKNYKILVNEINTIPGFTKISMYPKLWEKTGLSYSELLDNLIKLALERHAKENKLTTNYAISQTICN